MEQQKKSNVMDIIFVLDRSGSMKCLTEETICGFNDLISKQRQQNSDDTVFVTTILFNYQPRLLHDRVLLEELEPLTSEDYVTSGSTALYDAVGYAIAKEDLTNSLLKEKPQKVLMVITTDGYENSSKEYNHSQIKEIIKQKREQNWEFMFLGANIEAKDFAEHMGMDRGSAYKFNASSQGIGEMYKAADCFIADRRKK